MDDFDLNEIKRLIGEPVDDEATAPDIGINSFGGSDLEAVEMPDRKPDKHVEENAAPDPGYDDSDRVPRRRDGEKSAYIKALPFFVSLAVLTVLAWILPLRPTFSVSEKRNLSEFPAFSVSSLLSGKYFSSIDSWFSDTFTFRENWISLSDSVEKLYGVKTVEVIGDIPASVSIPEAIPSPVVNKKQEANDESISLTDSDDTSESIEEKVDNEPEEDEASWGGIVIDNDMEVADAGAKLVIGDSVFVYPGFGRIFAEMYSELMNRAAKLLEGKANFYCIIAPHAVTSKLTREDREKYGFVIEEDAFEYMYSLMNSNVRTVNVIPILQKHNSEYIVFRTDPHWTALGAYYAYVAWCEKAGETPVPLSEYKEYAWEDFLGTGYYTSGAPKKLKDNPDTVYAYEPPGDVHLYLDFENGDKLGTEYDLLLDRSVVKIDQYVTFLTSDQAKATFINNSIDDDSACAVLKNSFGNPFTYYLTQHYHYVYVLDLRYYNARGITSFVDKFNVDDVILIHSSDVCYFEGGYAMVNNHIR